jgi:hypothetical protein
VNVLPTKFLWLKRRIARPLTIKDACLALNSGKYNSESNAPPLLRIVQPKSVLRIYSGSEASKAGEEHSKAIISSFPTKEVLQGIVQRCDCSFIVGGDEAIREARVYLSSDYAPNSAEAAFFWYPVMPTKAQTDERLSTNQELDRVNFHPIHLNSTGQPACPIILPKLMEKGTIFTLPLFVRSESLGSVTITMRLQYLTEATLSLPIESTFDMKVQIVRPLAMSFAISSNIEFPCGVMRDIGSSPSSPVLQGSEITLSTTLSCLNALSKSISILDIVIEQHEDTSGIFDISEAQWKSSDKSGESTSSLMPFNE